MPLVAAKGHYVFDGSKSFKDLLGFATKSLSTMNGSSSHALPLIYGHPYLTLMRCHKRHGTILSHNEVILYPTKYGIASIPNSRMETSYVCSFTKPFLNEQNVYSLCGC